jgi:hypothetical protein
VGYGDSWSFARGPCLSRGSLHIAVLHEVEAPEPSHCLAALIVQAFAPRMALEKHGSRLSTLAPLPTCWVFAYRTLSWPRNLLEPLDFGVTAQIKAFMRAKPRLRLDSSIVYGLGQGCAALGEAPTLSCDAGGFDISTLAVIINGPRDHYDRSHMVDASSN